MGYPRMAIHAVQKAFIIFYPLIFSMNKFGGFITVDIFSYKFTFSILDANPSNFLTLLIHRQIPETTINMPVNIMGYAKFSATDAENPGVNLLSILFIREVSSMDTDDVSGELSRPMTLLADITGGAEIFHRSRNRTVIGTEYGHEDKR